MPGGRDTWQRRSLREKACGTQIIGVSSCSHARGRGCPEASRATSGTSNRPAAAREPNRPAGRHQNRHRDDLTEAKSASENASWLLVRSRVCGSFMEAVDRSRRQQIQAVQSTDRPKWRASGADGSKRQQIGRDKRVWGSHSITGSNPALSVSQGVHWVYRPVCGIRGEVRGDKRQGSTNQGGGRMGAHHTCGRGSQDLVVAHRRSRRLRRRRRHLHRCRGALPSPSPTTTGDLNSVAVLKRPLLLLGQANGLLRAGSGGHGLMSGWLSNRVLAEALGNREEAGYGWCSGT